MIPYQPPQPFKENTMHGTFTLTKLNDERVEAQRILNASTGLTQEEAEGRN